MGKIILTGNAQDISDSINSFNSNYHDDFKKVRTLSRRYVLEGLPSSEIIDFAKLLSQVLVNWGAGRRGAPRIKSDIDIETFLNDISFQNDIKSYVDSGWGVYKHGTNTSISDNNVLFLNLLNTIGNGIFIDNTNVTYPTKAIMLLTGLFVGIDSQVRKGLTFIGKKVFHKLSIYCQPMQIVQMQ